MYVFKTGMSKLFILLLGPARIRGHVLPAAVKNQPRFGELDLVRLESCFLPLSHVAPLGALSHLQRVNSICRATTHILHGGYAGACVVMIECNMNERSLE